MRTPPSTSERARTRSASLSLIPVIYLSAPQPHPVTGYRTQIWMKRRTIGGLSPSASGRACAFEP